MQKVSILNNAVLHCVAHCVAGPDMLETCKKVSNGKDKDGLYTIEFKVNGEELDFMKFLELLHSQYDHKVRIAALEVAKEKLYNVCNKCDDIVELLTNTQNEISNELTTLGGSKK